MVGPLSGGSSEAVHGVAQVAVHLDGVEAAWVVGGTTVSDWTSFGEPAEPEATVVADLLRRIDGKEGSGPAPSFPEPVFEDRRHVAWALTAPGGVSALLFRIAGGDAAAIERATARLRALIATVFDRSVASEPLPAGEAYEALHELARARASLEEKCRQYALAARLANLGVWSADPETGVIEMSREVRVICGVPRGVTMTVDAAIAAFDMSIRERVREDVDLALSKGESFEVEAPLKVGAGEQIWVRVLCEASVRDGAVQRLYGCLQDITDEVTARDDIVLLASRDYLTEVANRASFTNMVENRIKQFEPETESLFVLLIDVDHFKNINDSFGHDVGDNVLREVTRLLCQAVRGHDIVGRLGGDEFGVFVSSSPSPDLGDRVADRILELAAQSALLRSVGGGVTVSIGVAQVPSRDSSFKSMLKAADLALYEAKRAGRNRSQRYSIELGVEYENRERVMISVDEALRQDAFEPWYQPKLDLKTGLIDGFEALARWRHPTRGVLTPGAFFVALEDVRMSTRISERMLERAAADVGALKRKLGRSVGRVAVNVTEKMIADPGFPERLADLALANGLTPDDFELEVTEAVLLSRNVEDIRASLETMNDMGVAISLDDFGTGYASLSHLRAFPIDQLKIDMSFIRDLDTNRESRIISTAVINMAHDLQMEVVAEGVENSAALGLLEGLGCDSVQGFYIARPCPVDELEAILVENHAQAHASAEAKGRAAG